MSNYRKPKHAASHDANHFIVRNFMRDVCAGFEKHQRGTHSVYLCDFRGVTFCAIDTSGLGGCFLDWIISTDYGNASVEIKTPEAIAKEGQSLTENEKWNIENIPGHKWVISNDTGVYDVFESLLPT